MLIDLHYAVAGAITGFFVGMTGVGGGALMTPILLLFFGVAPATAVATDLWFAVVTKLFGFAVHARSGNVDWKVVKRLWFGSIPVAILVVLYVTNFHQLGQAAWLSQVIAMVLSLTAIGLLFSPYLLSKGRDQRLRHADTFKHFQPLLTVMAGAVLGICVTLTSIGAGALGSVMMIYLYPLRLTPHRLVATDIVHAIPLAAVAGLGYLWAGMVDVHMLLSLLAGSIPAVLIGAFWANKVSGRLIQVMLSVVLILASVKMFASV
jgi:uncharacterized membrane protein YfcA